MDPKKILITILVFASCAFATEEDVPPKHLYKIISVENWQASQSINHIQLSEEDVTFIHFSREDQLDRIIKKYWNNAEFVILKIDVEKLPGNLIYEANPGGANKYYHLYNGWIPRDAVIDEGHAI